jgi:hypothetical protein
MALVISTELVLVIVFSAPIPLKKEAVAEVTTDNALVKTAPPALPLTTSTLTAD